jgi:hypothetical protein
MTLAKAMPGVKAMTAGRVIFEGSEGGFLAV